VRSEAGRGGTEMVPPLKGEFRKIRDQSKKPRVWIPRKSSPLTVLT